MPNSNMPPSKQRVEAQTMPLEIGDRTYARKEDGTLMTLELKRRKWWTWLIVPFPSVLAGLGVDARFLLRIRNGGSLTK